ncbi:MAG: hypothetical protein ACNFW9_02055 [Candidatus Kerfeldbacteria bacterium]|jgi:hypothetical protein
MAKRELTRTEEKLLRRLLVSPAHEDAIRRVWETLEYKRKNFFQKIMGPVWTLVGMLILASLNVILYLSIYQSEDWVSKFENLVVVWVWVVFIVIQLTVVIIQLFHVSGKANQLNHYWIGRLLFNKGLMAYKVIMKFGLVVFLAMSDHVLTAVVFLIAYVLAIIFEAMVRESVKSEIKKAVGVK